MCVRLVFFFIVAVRYFQPDFRMALRSYEFLRFEVESAAVPWGRVQFLRQGIVVWRSVCVSPFHYLVFEFRSVRQS